MTDFKKIILMTVKANIIFTMIYLSLYPNLTYAESLRIPAGNSERMEDLLAENATLDVSLDKIEAFLYLIFGNNKKHEILVLSNNVEGEPISQVKMRICEIRELSIDERDQVRESLERWVSEGKRRRFEDMHDTGSIETMRSLLENPQRLKEYKDRFYIAIRDPSINGTDIIDIEGFVRVEGVWWWTEKTESQITTVEINPLNRDKSYERWKYGRSWESVPEPVNTAKFVGVFRQLLFYAVLRELGDGKEKMHFANDARQPLEREGIVAGAVYTRRELVKLIYRRMAKNIRLLERSFIENEDSYAQKLLQQIKSLRQEHVGFSL